MGMQVKYRSSFRDNRSPGLKDQKPYAPLPGVLLGMEISFACEKDEKNNYKYWPGDRRLKKKDNL